MFSIYIMCTRTSSEESNTPLEVIFYMNELCLSGVDLFLDGLSIDLAMC
jgi:hypothetical protein